MTKLTYWCQHPTGRGYPFKIWFSHNAFYPAARNRICKARDARVQTSNCCRERHPHWPTGRQGEKHHALTLHNTNTFLLSIFFLLLFSSHFSLQVIRPHLCQSQMKAASNTAPCSPFVKPSMLSVDFFERGEVRRKEKKRRERKKGEAQSSKLSLFIIIFFLDDCKYPCLRSTAQSAEREEVNVVVDGSVSLQRQHFVLTC